VLPHRARERDQSPVLDASVGAASAAIYGDSSQHSARHAAQLAWGELSVLIGDGIAHWLLAALCDALSGKANQNRGARNVLGSSLVPVRVGHANTWCSDRKLVKRVAGASLLSSGLSWLFAGAAVIADRAVLPLHASVQLGAMAA
jgi:hypothetical protein